MKRLTKPIILLFLLLTALILPFLFFGQPIESAIRAWFTPPPSRATVAMLVIACLSTDIMLPIPSSFVSTLAGAELGVFLATLSTWVGMTLGALFGYALARVVGPPIARRFSSEEDLEQVEKISKQRGPIVLVLLRPLPVLAEASVLLFGAAGLPLKRFLPPVALSNLAIALVYSIFGAAAAGEKWLPLALGLSLIVPLLATILMRRFLSPKGV